MIFIWWPTMCVMMYLHKSRPEFWNLTTDRLTFDYIYSLPIFKVFITLNRALKHTSMLWRYNDLQWSCRRQLGHGKAFVMQTVISSSKTFFYRFQVWKQIWRLTIFTSGNVNIMLLSIIITICNFLTCDSNAVIQHYQKLHCQEAGWLNCE